MNEWISVKDKLPESRSMVLVNYIEDGNQGVASVFYRYWDDDNEKDWEFPRYDCDVFNWDDNIEVTHWMHLPKPPKE